MDGQDGTDELLTPMETRRELGVSASSLRRYTATGVLPVAGRTELGDRRFRRADVEALRERLAAGGGRIVRDAPVVTTEPSS